MLDIFHAGQHIAAAAAGLHGEGSVAAADWLERGRAKHLAGSWPGLLDQIGEWPSEGRTPSGQAALDEMLGDFAKHTALVGDFGRLRSGPVDRQRGGGGAGQEDGPTAEGVGPGLEN